MKIEHRYLSIILVATCFISPSFANDDDDDLLLFLPAILAGNSGNSGNSGDPVSLTQIQKLPGDWYFDKKDSFDGTISTDEFRFYRNTIAQIDNTSSGIDGDQFLGDFDFVYEDNVAVVYDSAASFFVLLSLWGPPTYDSGSAYVFKSASSNTSSFDCHYFTNGQGEIRSYYLGFGGTIACNSLTKRQKSAAEDSSIQAMIFENYPVVVNEDRWQQHLKNIEMNEKSLKTEGQALKVNSEDSSEIQELVNKVNKARED